MKWDWWMADNSSVVTLFIRGIMLNDGCSCWIQNECIQSEDIYRSFSSIQYFAIPEWNIGYSTVDTLLHSTLKRFYIQPCIDSLMYYTNTAVLKQMVIQKIVDKIFVEQWQINASYSAYFNILLVHSRRM